MSKKQHRNCPACNTNLDNWFEDQLINKAINQPNLTQEPLVDNTTDKPEDFKKIEFGTNNKEYAGEDSPLHDEKVDSKQGEVLNPQVKPNVITYRPAFRAFIAEWLISILALVFLMYPIGMLSLFINEEALMGLSDIPWVVQSIKLFSFILIIYYSGRAFLTWFANRITLKSDMVECSKGIIRRNSSSVRYNHIRSVEIFQGIIDRIFDTGRIELATAGSSEIEIVFARVASPLRIKTEINKKIELATSKK